MVNITSRVSMVAVGVPVAAMVILMSVFGGFDRLIREMYRGFDPDLMVVPAQGVVFERGVFDIGAIEGLQGVERTDWVLDGSALAEYRGRQATVSIRGVDSLRGGVVLGQGVAYELGARVGFGEQVDFVAPRRGSYSALLPVSMVTTASAPVEGVFVMDAETDGEWVLVPLELAERLLDYRGRASGLAVRAGSSVSGYGALQAAVEGVVGEDFKVLTREQQRESMYRVMVMEKWGVFVIGLVVLVIASFSIVGSLVMMVIDKRAAIAVLGAMGAPRAMIRRVFVLQGLIIGAVGAVGGLVLGVVVCGVQQVFGLVPMPGGSFLIDDYPVRMAAGDIAAICGAFVVVIYLMSLVTVRATVKKV